MQILIRLSVLFSSASFPHFSVKAECDVKYHCYNLTAVFMAPSFDRASCQQKNTDDVLLTPQPWTYCIAADHSTASILFIILSPPLSEAEKNVTMDTGLKVLLYCKTVIDQPVNTLISISIV